MHMIKVGVLLWVVVLSGYVCFLDRSVIWVGVLSRYTGVLSRYVCYPGKCVI